MVNEFYVYKNQILSHTNEGFKMEFSSHMEALGFLLNNEEEVKKELLNSLSDQEIELGWMDLRKDYTGKRDELNEFYKKEIYETRKEIQIREKRKSLKARKEERQLREKRQRLEEEWENKLNNISKEFEIKRENNTYYQEEKRRSKIKSEQYRQEQKKQENQRELQRLESNHSIIMNNGGYDSLLNKYNEELKKHEGILKRTNDGTYNNVMTESRISRIKREIEEIKKTREYMEQVQPA